MTPWEDNQFIIMPALDHVVSALTGACVHRWAFALLSNIYLVWPLLEDQWWVPLIHVSCLPLYMLMLLMGCVSLSETWDRAGAEMRALIGDSKSPQCSPSAIKVTATQKMECSLGFFINRPDRLGPESRIKYCMGFFFWARDPVSSDITIWGKISIKDFFPYRIQMFTVSLGLYYLFVKDALCKQYVNVWLEYERDYFSFATLKLLGLHSRASSHVLRYGDDTQHATRTVI